MLQLAGKSPLVVENRTSLNNFSPSLICAGFCDQMRTLRMQVSATRNIENIFRDLLREDFRRLYPIALETEIIYAPIARYSTMSGSDSVTRRIYRVATPHRTVPNENNPE